MMMSEMNRPIAVSHRALAIAVSCLLAGLPSLATGQGLRDLARERAQQGSSEPILIPAPPSEIFTRKSIAELASEAVLVVEGRLWRGESALAGTDNDRVITEYTIAVTNVSAGDLPGKNNVSIPLTLTVLGGQVVVEGIVVRQSNQNIGEILDGAEYLLFLMRSRRRPPVDGLYEVYYEGIFQISDDRARSLSRPPPDAYGADRGLPLANVRAEVLRGRAAR